MSGMNGDKARFQRRRKQKVSRRVRKNAMLASLPQQAAALSKEKSA